MEDNLNCVAKWNLSFLLGKAGLASPSYRYRGVRTPEPSSLILDNHSYHLTQFILDCTSINLPESNRIPVHNPPGVRGPQNFTRLVLWGWQSKTQTPGSQETVAS